MQSYKKAHKMRKKWEKNHLYTIQTRIKGTITSQSNIAKQTVLRHYP